MKRIGIIGAGAIANAHINGFKNNTGCRLVAIADINLELAKKRAAEYGIEKVYGDYKELLRDAEIDAVSIVTPTFTHTGMVIEALKSGKDVLCEKPPALFADDVRKCEAVAKECSKLLMYAFVCRFRPQVQFLKKYIKDGKMGKIVSAEAARIYRSMGFNGWFAIRLNPEASFLTVQFTSLT
jgi:predicted dehydrogenase